MLYTNCSLLSNELYIMGKTDKQPLIFLCLSKAGYFKEYIETFSDRKIFVRKIFNITANI